MLTLDLAIDLIQILDQLLLLRLFTEHGRHVFAQGVDDVGVHLGQPGNKSLRLPLTERIKALEAFGAFARLNVIDDNEVRTRISPL